MKKTKVVIPALGIIAFATAASITGTVAWFTASRSVTITAGEFAVINTKDNLDLEMMSGIGTTANTAAKTVTVANAAADTAVLTDGTVDHTSYTAKPTIIAPDASGVNVGKIVNYDAATADTVAGTGIKRGAFTESGTTYNVYTAFTWDMKFTVSFAGSQDKKVGLFLDLSQDTWAHRIVKFKDGHVVTAAEAAVSYYTDAKCSTAATIAVTDGNFGEGKTIDGDQSFYAVDPLDTGKAFKIAFIPKYVKTGSMGYTKIWSPNQTAAKSDFVDIDKPAAFESKAYAENDLVYYNDAAYKCKTAHTATEWVAANWEPVTLASKTLCGEDPENPVSNMSETTATTSLTGSDTTATWAAAAVGAGKVIMAKGDTAEPVPADATITSANALSGKANYLGYFAPEANSQVYMTFTCVAYYEGTDENIEAKGDTIYETMTTSLRFGVATLQD